MLTGLTLQVAVTPELISPSTFCPVWTATTTRRGRRLGLHVLQVEARQGGQRSRRAEGRSTVPPALLGYVPAALVVLPVAEKPPVIVLPVPADPFVSEPV